MTIHKVSSRDYAQVTSECVENNIKAFYNNIGDLIFNSQNKRLRDCNKAQLNQIAAELETVKKRLEWIIERKY